MATIGEELIEEGVQKGLQQGVLEGKRDLVLQQLRQRFGAAVDGQAERRIATAGGEQLDRWASRVLTATTLADVFNN